MTNVLNSFYSLIDRGRLGKNLGISTGFRKLDNVIYGLQKKYMYLVGADSGVGKSSLTMFMFVYKPLIDAIENSKEFYSLFFSFEMSSEVLYAKLLSMYIKDRFNKEISYMNILSLTSKLDDESYDIILACKPWLQEVEKRLTIIDSPVPPKGLYKITMEWLSRFGTWETKDGNNIKYTLKNPDTFLLGIVDHVRLIASSPESNTVKARIDEACDYMISLRNRTSMSWVVVQQLNRNFKSSDRRNSDYSLLQLDDFSDSSGTVQAAEVVLGIYDPIREKRKNCEDYNIERLKSINFKLLQVLKNRFGESNKNLGLAFYARAGLWDELPKPNEIDYDKYNSDKKSDVTTYKAETFKF